MTCSKSMAQVLDKGLLTRFVATSLPALFCAGLSGCLDTGADGVDLSLSVAGTSHPDPIAARGDWQVSLSRADLAFGPLWLCAGTRSGELCDTARAEWRETAVVDALAPEARVVGRLYGVEGMVRSAMYDLGVVSRLTTRAPLVLAAASELGDASLAIAGVAQRDGVQLEFSVQIVIEQGELVEQGVPVVRVASQPDLERELNSDTAGLTVRFDPAPWIEDVDFGLVQRSCEPDCAEPVELANEGQAYRALRVGVVSRARPQFEWSPP